MKISAGLAIIQDNKLLLVHPTNAPWFKTYSIPKGHVDKGEDILDAAIRETFEEIGVTFNKSEIDETSQNVIDYLDENGEVYKKVYFYIVYPTVPLNPKEFKLQIEEVDWSGFLTKEEASKRIFGRFKPLINLLD